jgi:hypothetical protein
VGALKHSRFAPLLRKESVRQALERAGGGRLDAADVAGVWPAQPEAYRLTLGTWGHRKDWRQTWHQTSRPGFNLVLHLNFTARHDAELRRAFGRHMRFDMPGFHPASKRFNTLAWSRIDLCLDRGEALIEEIQSDWLKAARRELRWLRACQPDKRRAYTERLWGTAVPLETAERYVERVLTPHARVWDEAMLAATLWVLRDLLGMKAIYLHTGFGGAVLKRCGRPPYSVYEKLPRRFCLERTWEPPRFLLEAGHRRVRRALRCGPEWWVMRR